MILRRLATFFIIVGLPIWLPISLLVLVFEIAHDSIWKNIDADS